MYITILVIKKKQSKTGNGKKVLTIGWMEQKGDLKLLVDGLMD